MEALIDLETFLKESRCLPSEIRDVILEDYLYKQHKAYFRDVVLHPHSLMPKIVELGCKSKTELSAMLHLPYIGTNGEHIHRVHYGYTQCQDEIDKAFIHATPESLYDHSSTLSYHSEGLNLELQFLIQHVTIHTNAKCAYAQESCRYIVCRSPCDLCLPVPHLALNPVWQGRMQTWREPVYVPREDGKGPKSIRSKTLLDDVVAGRVPVKQYVTLYTLNHFRNDHLDERGILGFMRCCDMPFPDTPADISMRDFMGRGSLYACYCYM
jgi:hypothetical protein